MTAWENEAFKSTAIASVITTAAWRNSHQ